MSTHWNQQLLEGAEEGDLELMREALQNGADVNIDKHGYSAFHFACINGDLEVIRFLICSSYVRCCNAVW